MWFAALVMVGNVVVGMGSPSTCLCIEFANRIGSCIWIQPRQEHTLWTSIIEESGGAIWQWLMPGGIYPRFRQVEKKQWDGESREVIKIQFFIFYFYPFIWPCTYPQESHCHALWRSLYMRGRKLWLDSYIYIYIYTD